MHIYLITASKGLHQYSFQIMLDFLLVGPKDSFEDLVMAGEIDNSWGPVEGPIALV